GLVGVFVLVPAIRSVQLALEPVLGSIPLFAGPAYGVGLLTAGILLAVMVVPFIVSVSREVLLAVPQTQRDAALALGATRWETVRDVVVHYARSGILGSVFLALARALGETMAVTMVIGNRPEIAASLFALVELLHRAPGARRRGRRRHGERHRGEREAPAHRRAGRHPGWLSGRRLPRRVRPRIARQLPPLRGGRAERHPLDRDRHHRLRPGRHPHR